MPFSSGRSRHCKQECVVQVSQIRTRVGDTAADAVVVGVFQDSQPAGAAAEVDAALGGAVRALLERKEFSGRAYETAPLLVPVGKARQALVIGLGAKETFDTGAAFRCTAAAARHLAGKRRERVAFFLDDGWADDHTESAVAGAILGCQGQDLYRAEKSRHPFEAILWSGGNEAAIARGRILGEAINLTRRLVNEPSEEVYPETFAARAADVAKLNGLGIEIWDADRLAKERCGALLAVAKGSNRPARLVIMRHQGAGKSRRRWRSSARA